MISCEQELGGCLHLVFTNRKLSFFVVVVVVVCFTIVDCVVHTSG